MTQNNLNPQLTRQNGVCFLNAQDQSSLDQYNQFMQSNFNDYNLPKDCKRVVKNVQKKIKKLENSRNFKLLTDEEQNLIKIKTYNNELEFINPNEEVNQENTYLQNKMKSIKKEIDTNSKSDFKTLLKSKTFWGVVCVAGIAGGLITSLLVSQPLFVSLISAVIMLGTYKVFASPHKHLLSLHKITNCAQSIKDKTIGPENVLTNQINKNINDIFKENVIDHSMQEDCLNFNNLENVRTNNELCDPPPNYNTSILQGINPLNERPHSSSIILDNLPNYETAIESLNRRNNVARVL